MLPMDSKKPNFTALLIGIGKKMSETDVLERYAGLTVVERNKLSSEDVKSVIAIMLEEIEVDEEARTFSV